MKYRNARWRGPKVGKPSEISWILQKFGDRSLDVKQAFSREISDKVRTRTSNGPPPAHPVTTVGADMASENENSSLERVRERWNDPLLTTLTVLLILMLFVFAPLQAVGVKLFQLFGFASALVMIAGVFFLSGSPMVAVVLVAAFIMAGTAAVSRHTAPSVLDVHLLAAALLLLGITLSYVVARAVFSPGRVSYHRIIGAILVYLSVAVTFAALFTIVGLLVPHAFSGMVLEDNPALASNVIYFSFVTLTSTGYGDIFPVHPVARSLCNLETIIGQLYPATLLARLVSLEIEGRR
jgi:Ion channel